LACPAPSNQHFLDGMLNFRCKTGLGSLKRRSLALLLVALLPHVSPSSHPPKHRQLPKERHIHYIKSTGIFDDCYILSCRDLSCPKPRHQRERYRCKGTRVQEKGMGAWWIVMVRRPSNSSPMASISISTGYISPGKNVNADGGPSHAHSWNPLHRTSPLSSGTSMGCLGRPSLGATTNGKAPARQRRRRDRDTKVPEAALTAHGESCLRCAGSKLSSLSATPTGTRVFSRARAHHTIRLTGCVLGGVCFASS
jgi:hypothetical protein